MVRGESTEVDAYIFIKKNLGLVGWDTRNPSRVPEGQVYTQNECLNHSEMHKYLGLRKPENVVKINEQSLWVIEAKKECTDSGLKQALKEVKYYAEQINKSKIINVNFVTGIAGNDHDSYRLTTEYYKDSEFKPVLINGKEITGFLSPDEARTILQNNNPELEDAVIDVKLFLSKAGYINDILHLGAVLPNQRAKVMASILLSMSDETEPNINASPSVLISDINSRAKRILKKEGRQEFEEYIRISLPPTEDNHMKFKGALVETIQELNLLNIRSAMNSGDDVLGHFYEVFLKYANWAKDLGIVLTPRHITKFVVDIMDITPYDIVYDPTCGTGGFLVAAFDYVKKNYNKSQIEKFKENSIFGVEQDPSVASLAIVNMFFRGDGKNNIMEGNCFSKFLTSNISKGVASAKFIGSQSNKPPVTKVLMNPPFALKKSNEKEYKFINQALKQMDDGGLLFSVLPYSVMVKPNKFKTWRHDLLKKNTLLSVVTFPIYLFYPIGITTVGIFIKKGIPHDKEQPVLWCRALHDGLLKSKGKRLPNDKVSNDLEKIRDVLRSFLNNTKIHVENVLQFQKAEPINFDDTHFELVPEVYLDQKPPTIEELQNQMEYITRDSVAFIIKQGEEDNV